MEIGRKQIGKILRIGDHGAYVYAGGHPEEAVLLPAKYVPEGMKVGDEIEVFLYRDSLDRPVATTKAPALTLGEIGCLKVRDVTKIGAFLDWGLEKDLFLPFKEQTGKLKSGDKVVVALYLDKSGRLCGTMRITPYLKSDSPYQKDDKVEGVIYELHPSIGAFVAVDCKYFGLIPKQEWFSDGQVGDTVNARVLRVRPDGKLDLSGRGKAYKQLATDAEVVWEALMKRGGEMYLHDKSDPAEIQKVTGLSKNAFKRAVGHLLKERKIELTGESIKAIRQI